LETIEKLYAVFNKTEILTGNYGQNRIKQFGINRFQEVETKVAPYRGTRLFDLGVFVSQKPPEVTPEATPEESKEEDKPCIITSTPTTTGQLQLLC
jgi:hypothetical protein